MKKEEVYKLINYNGFYNDEVKKKLKNLIKKYHPDKNKGDSKIIKVIYEVKKELETNKVSYNPIKKENVKEKTSFISKEECQSNLIRLNKEEEQNRNKLNQLYSKLSKSFKEYEKQYKEYCELKNTICEIEDRYNKVKKHSFLEQFFLLIMIMLVVFNIFKFNIINLLITIIILITIFLLMINTNKRIKSIKNIMKNNVKYNKKISFEINQIQEKIKELSDEIHYIERINNRIKNDIRFYKNMQ